jgi:hypothetical protein
MLGKSVILRFNDMYRQDKYGIRRMYATMDAKNMAKLINAADLKANPREAKVGDTTDDIRECLAKTPDLFQFKSKGLLIATVRLRELDRQRCEVFFDDPDIEGILDGGHNTLAIALFLLERVVEDRRELKSVKIWSDLQKIWDRYYELVLESLEDLTFLVPIEILFPVEDREQEFIASILEISQARNANAQLTAETKANKAGYYLDIRKVLDKRVAESVEWKTNDGGTIKVKDLVALSLIPLSLISEQIAGVKYEPTIIYSSKGRCVEVFNSIFEHQEVSTEDGATRKLKNETVRSALEFMRDFPRLYDKLYTLFPEAYNAASPGFGKIDCVKTENATKAKQRIAKDRLVSKFYETPVKWHYPDPFFLPILFGLRALIVEKNGILQWATDPDAFIEMHLEEIVRPYQEFVIKMAANYDPQKVGKSTGAYQFAEEKIKAIFDLKTRTKGQMSLSGV